MTSEHFTDEERNEFERKRALLPKRVGLCPEHQLEFFYPLRDDESNACPCCSLPMSVYVMDESVSDRCCDRCGENADVEANYCVRCGKAMTASEQLSAAAALALQTYLNQAFRRYGLEVAVGLTKNGVAIRSQDARVDARNIVVVSAQNSILR